MRKFLRRPALAFSAVIVVVFLFIFLRSYVKFLNNLSASDFVVDYPYNDIETEPNDGSRIQHSIGPQWPDDLNDSKPAANTAITLGTFKALNGTCFMRNGQEYRFEEPDKFDDLQNAIKNMMRLHKSHDADADRSKSTTLAELRDLSFSFSSKTKENSYVKFCSEISRHRMYSPVSDAVENVLYDMKTQPIYQIKETDTGSQFKLRTIFENDVIAMFKPKRTSREQQAQPNQIHLAEYERHTSEIAAFHLDRILEFYRAMPAIGRNVNMIVELMRIAEPKFQRTFYISPKPDENLCFCGNCKVFCDHYHPICGNGTMIEGSFTVYFPEAIGTERQIDTHPWQQSEDEKNAAEWETDPGYCEKIKTRHGFTKGRLLLDLIDLSILDFLTGNMDRYNYQRFKAFLNDTFVLNCDHGRAFGRAFHDELKILAPMLQCCMIKSSTLTTLLNIHNGKQPLSTRMSDSLMSDPVAPVLWEPHLKALDRRLVIVLQAIRDCIDRHSVDSVIIPGDNVNFT